MYTSQIQKSVSLNIHAFVVLAIISVVYIALLLAYTVTQDLDYALWATILLFFGCYYSSVHVSHPLAIYPLFLALFFLFLYSRPALEILSSGYDFGYCTLFTRKQLEQPIKLEILNMLSAATFFPTIIYLLYYKKPIRIFDYQPSQALFQVGKYLAFFASPFVIYNLIMEAVYVFQNGYLSIFNGQMRMNSGTFFGTTFHRLMVLGFFICFSSLLNTKRFKVVAFWFIFFSALGSLKGQRGDLFLSIIFVIWYYNSVAIGRSGNAERVSSGYAKYALLGVIFVYLGQLFIYFRVGYSYDFFEIPFQFFHLNGTSICVAGYMLDSRSLLHPEGIPYMFSPIYDYFYRLFNYSEFYSASAAEVLELSNYLGWHLTHSINPESFFQGHGTGTSFLAEFYSFGGYFGLVFWTSLSLIIAMKLEVKVYKKRWALFFAPIVFLAYIYMARGSLLKSIDEIVPYGLAYILLILCLPYVKGNNVRI